MYSIGGVCGVWLNDVLWLGFGWYWIVSKRLTCEFCVSSAKVMHDVHDVW